MSKSLDDFALSCRPWFFRAVAQASKYIVHSYKKYIRGDVELPDENMSGQMPVLFPNVTPPYPFGDDFPALHLPAPHHCVIGMPAIQPTPVSAYATTEDSCSVDLDDAVEAHDLQTLLDQPAEIVPPANLAAMSCYGLFVSHSGGNLRGVHNDVALLSAAFERRGFTVDRLCESKATRSTIVDAIVQYAPVTTKDSLFVFHYSGHGTKEGELCLYDEDTGRGSVLQPWELLVALGHLEGQKLVVLDGCYTANVAKWELPARTVLIGSKEIARECEIETLQGHEVVDMFANNPVMGISSRAILRSLSSRRGPVSVDRMLYDIRSDHRIIVRGQRICDFQGTQIFIPAILD